MQSMGVVVTAQCSPHHTLAAQSCLHSGPVQARDCASSQDLACAPLLAMFGTYRHVGSHQ